MGIYRFNNPERRNNMQRITIPPQFTLEQLHISPFDAERQYMPDGRWEWKPLPRSLSPTGIHQLDALLRYFAEGHWDRRPFYTRYGITDEYQNETGNPFLAFVYVLTGMSMRELHNRYCLRTADLLLQYTDLHCSDIARRSGSYDASTLNRLYRKYYNTTPRQRRLALRKQDDRIGFYRLADGK